MSQVRVVERHQSVGTDENLQARTDVRPVPGIRFGAVALPASHPSGPALAEDEFMGLYPSLHRFACVTADADLDPDDLVQEALTRFLRVRGSQPIDHPDAYLRRTIVNLVMSHRRRAGSARSKARQLTEPEDRADDYPSDVASVLERVGPVDRALLTMTVLEGRPVDEASQALGLSATAARARLSRAKRALRREELR